MTQVFHLTNFRNSIWVYDVENDKPNFPADFTLVADVATDDLDDAYSATQNITEFWGNNPEILNSYVKSCRSTSVGDVVKTEAGELFYVDNFGFKKF